MDYLTYDKNKIVSIACMNCKTEVQALATGTLYTRFGVPIEFSQIVPLENLAKEKRHVNIINNSTGQKSYIDPILCKTCFSGELNLPEIIEQTKIGWRLGMEAQRKSKDEIDKYMSTHGDIRAEEANGS